MQRLSRPVSDKEPVMFSVQSRWGICGKCPKSNFDRISNIMDTFLDVQEIFLYSSISEAAEEESFENFIVIF